MQLGYMATLNRVKEALQPSGISVENFTVSMDMELTQYLYFIFFFDTVKKFQENIINNFLFKKTILT